jgi:uncharacterized lipoprotein YehR (DUF1307 family)
MSKILIGLVIAAALSLSMTGCEKKPGEAVKDAANATGSAAETTGEYLTQKKDDAVKAIQEKIDFLDTKWQELQDKAQPTTDEAKAEFQKAKDQMAMTLADAKTKLVEAKDASADVWQKNVKPEIDAALDKAQKLYEDTAARFGGK